MEKFRIDLVNESQMYEIIEYLESINAAPKSYIVGTYMPNNFERSELTFVDTYDADASIRAFSMSKITEHTLYEKYKHCYNRPDIELGFSTEWDFEQGDICEHVVDFSEYKESINTVLSIN